MPELSIAGIPASDGIAMGTFYLREEFVPQRDRVAGSAQEERSLFENALAMAVASLASLMLQLDTTAAEILEFQHELLNDEDFLAPVLQSIKNGMPADTAWTLLLDAEIEEYASASDEFMAARADDIRDLKKRVLGYIHGKSDNTFDMPEMTGLILASHSLTPSEFLELNLGRITGIAISEGSPTSHVSILARARGIPMLVGCGGALTLLKTGYCSVIDTQNSRLVHNLEGGTQRVYDIRLASLNSAIRAAREKAHLPAITAGGESVRVYANVDDPAVLADVDVTNFDGIGLTRTEFLFEGGDLPNENRQYEIYSKIMQWASGRPVTIRTLDAGGDKPIPGVTFDGETNPFLGLRGYRLSQLRKEVFVTQLRALARAAVHGSLKVMIPMVTVQEEMDEFRDLFRDVVNDLKRDGIECALPSLGVMIEVPAAALNAEAFDADFYSIGSNDLIQYTTACARDNSLLTHLAKADNPAVVKLITMVVDAAKSRLAEVSVCGDMASMPSMIPVLLKAGIRSLSVAIAQGPVVKQIVRQWDDNAVRGDGTGG
jgi:phosphoenolpyruvate-protein phosphotransferase (PTS system enzyme I)